MTRLSLWLVTIALLAAGSACSRSAPSDEGAGTGTEEARPVHDQMPSHASPPRVTSAMGGSSNAASSLLLKSPDVLGMPNPELLALSIEEAEWLDKHGYPTAEELQLLDTFDSHELELRLRNQRDGKAGALLGHQLIERGDHAKAAAVLAASASTGSLYAYQLLGVAQLERRRASGGFTQSSEALFVARMEVARMLGDHNVDMLIRRYAPDFDRKRHAAAVLAQVAEFMRQRGADAQIRGIPAMGPDPRPNSQEWRRLEVATSVDEFEVYDRRR